MKQTDRYLQQHDLVQRQPPRQWWMGSPMGNGRMDGMVYFPGHFELLLNKLDIWTCCPAKSTLVPHRRVLNLLKQGNWSRTFYHDAALAEAVRVMP